MKKSIIALLLVALIATSSAFAMVASGPSADLKLTTAIEGINAMRLTSERFAPAVPSESELNSAEGNGDTEVVSLDTDGTTLAYLSILTNNREGFKVSIKADPLTSSDKKNEYSIDYVLSCGGQSLDTDKTDSLTIEEGTISALSAFSYAIAVDLDDDQYNAALEDNYEANVSFEYTAN